MPDHKPIPQPPAPQAGESIPTSTADLPLSVAGEEDPEAGLDELTTRDALKGEARHARAAADPGDPTAPPTPPEIDPGPPPREVPPPPPPITVPGPPPSPPIQARVE